MDSVFRTGVLRHFFNFPIRYIVDHNSFVLYRDTILAIFQGFLIYLQGSLHYQSFKLTLFAEILKERFNLFNFNINCLRLSSCLFRARMYACAI